MVFNEFASAIERAASRGASEFPRSVSAVCREFCAPGHWRQLMQSAKDEIATDKLPRGNSHAHENGFQKIGLFKSQTGLQIRLHVWYSDSARDVSSIHNHRWDFVSAVLCGSLFARNYQETTVDGAQEFIRRTLSDAIAGEQKVTQDTGVCGLMTHSEYEVSSGGVHALSADVPHLAYPVPGTDVTATIVVTAPSQKSGSIQYVPHGTTQREARKEVGARALFSPAESIEEIERLLQRTA